MQRTLVMIRHAKSSWSNPLQSDFERPLNDRGELDAPMMGERLLKYGIKPDLIIASTARRTRRTAKKIAGVLGYEIDNIKWEEKLYHCIPSVFEEMIGEIADAIRTVFFVAHNPGITEFVNELSPDFSIDNMPTCGLVAAHFTADGWDQFSFSERKIFLFDYPRKVDEIK